MLFTMICTCPFLQESGEFSLSSLHPPIRQRTASCTWGLEGGCGRGEGGNREGRRGGEDDEGEEEMMQRKEVSGGTFP